MNPEEPPRTYILAGSMQLAREWCRDNGVHMADRSVRIITEPHRMHGHRLRSQDTVQLVGSPERPIPAPMLEMLAVWRATLPRPRAQ